MPEEVAVMLACSSCSTQFALFEKKNVEKVTYNNQPIHYKVKFEATNNLTYDFKEARLFCDGCTINVGWFNNNFNFFFYNNIIGLWL